MSLDVRVTLFAFFIVCIFTPLLEASICLNPEQKKGTDSAGDCLDSMIDNKKIELLANIVPPYKAQGKEFATDPRKSPIVILEDKVDRYQLGNLVQYIEDKNGLLTLDDIRSESNEKLWLESKWDVPSFGFNSFTYWFRFDIKSTLEENREWLFEIGYPFHNEIELYIIASDGSVEVKKVGSLRPFHERGFDNMNFILPIQTKSLETKSIYLKSKSTASQQFPLTLWSPKKFAQEMSSVYGGLFLYYGMALVIILYNLLLFLTIRNISYLYYVLYLTSYVIFQFSMNGLAFQYLWPDSPFWASRNIPFCVGFAFFWCFLFSKNFLDSKRTIPRMDRFSVIVMIWGLVSMALSMTAPYSLVVKNTVLLSVFGFSYMTLMGVFSLLSGNRAARFYVLAFTIFFIGGILSASRVSGILPANFITTFGVQIGSAIEFILLSLALGDKISIEQRKSQKDIEDLNNSLEKKVEEKTRDIRSILTNIHQGIFTLHLENNIAVIDSEFSDHLVDILETRDLKGKTIDNTILNNCSLTGDQSAIVSNIVYSCLGEDSINFSMNSPNLPSEFEKYFENGSSKTLEIDWSPVVRKEDDIVQKLLVTIRDVTALRKLQTRTKEQQEELNYISELVNISAEKFSELIQFSKMALNENERLITNSKSRDIEALKILFINLHTLKGMGRMFGLTKMTAVVHEGEQYCALLKNKENEAWNQKKLLDDLARIKDILQIYIDINTQKLGRKETTDKIVVEKFIIEKNIQNIKSFVKQPLPEYIKDFLKIINMDLTSAIYHKSGDTVRDIFSNIGTLARDLKKEHPNVTLNCDDFNVTQHGAEVLRNVFVHMLRNSMDHGIETFEERVSKGKNPAGNIFVDLNLSGDDKVIIRYRDDGRGIDISKLRAIGEKMNYLEKDELKDPLKVANLIFNTGISTSKSITEISGRGVGMAAIKEYIEKSGGLIKLKLVDIAEDGRPFLAFELEIFIPVEFLVA
ncbi:MAG: 7TM diverse intracellular signaling domain-containing protein [Oligoflexus sp.]